MPDRRTPYALSASRVALARPFKDPADVRATLAAFRRGDSIGFLRRASLVAMGLIPRADGVFRLSPKYR